MVTTSFRNDAKYFKALLNLHIPFSVTRYGDGEMYVFEGRLGRNAVQEFQFDGQEHLQQELLESYEHKQDNYFVGVPCKCCVGEANFNKMKVLSKKEDKKLTWANIFVNSNFTYFQDSIVPQFKNYKVNMVAPGSPENLPFDVANFYEVGYNAWVNNAGVYDELVEYISSNKVEGELFLFCAGPFAKTLCYKLFKQFPRNTYLDLGSVFLRELGLKANRGYLNGADTLNKVCVW